MYRYTRISYRDGQEVLRETLELDAITLAMHRLGYGRGALIELVNKWNKQGLKNGLLHVYTVE